MSELVAKLSGDSIIKAVLSSDAVLKAQINSGLTVNTRVDGGDYIHWDVITTANNQSFTSADLVQYAAVTKVNLMKNGVYLEPTNYTLTAGDTIQVNVLLTAGDTLDVLATGSAGGGGGTGTPGGLSTQVQYNNGGVFAGSAGLTYTGASQMLTAGNITVGAIHTTSSNLGSISGVTILGGTPGYIIQTDGAGTLSWTAQTGGGGGNTPPGGTNTQVQFNDNGIFAGNNSLLFNKTSGTLTATNIVGSGTGLTSLNGANVSGVVANATHAAGATTATTASFSTTAGTVTTAEQPNITQVGLLTNLQVTGNSSASLFIGSGASLTTLPGANVTGNVNQANTSIYAGTVTTAAQPNITSVGTLSSLLVSGNIQANLFIGNVNSALTAGTVTTAAQPNITTTGSLINLTVVGNAAANAVRTDNLQYANGVTWTFPSSFGNSNVAAFMPTYTGTLSPSIITIVQGSAKTLAEPVTVAAISPTATTILDLVTSTMFYFTVAIAQNTILNFRGNSTVTLNSLLSIGQSMTTGVVITNHTGTGFIINTVQIDGTGQTIHWMGATPVAATSGLDCYVFTIIKTAASTYTVIGNRGTTT